FNTLSYGDSGDWAANAGNDAYNAFGYSGVANLVTAADLQVMDAIGWDRMTTAKVDTPPVVTPTRTNIVATNGQSFTAATLFTASDADGDAITQYDFWDTGGGGGHFLVNGASQPTNQDVYVTAAQLGQTTYQSGSGTDTLWVRAYDGIKWGDWSSSFTVTASGETSASSTSSDPGAREAREIAVSDGNWKPVRSDGEPDWRLMVNPSDSLL